MKKILAILAVLCLGIMMIPNVSEDVEATQTPKQEIFVLWAGSTPNFINGMEQGYMREANPTTSDTISYVPFAVRNQTGTSLRGMLRFNLNQTHPKSTIYSVKLRLNITVSSFEGTMNVSIRKMDDAWDMHDVSWTYRDLLYGNNNGTWKTLGGDFNDTVIDTITISANGTYEWNITSWYVDVLQNGYKNNGLGFITNDTGNDKVVYIHGVISSASEWNQIPRLNITYIEPSDPILTNIVKDIWNLKGFSNITAKLASVIFSEISNCKAIVYKNATGYYYTYSPTWGILEDYDIVYGDGLFILTTANTTWDHT